MNDYETIYEMVMRVMDDHLPYHPFFCGPCWSCRQRGAYANR